MSFKAIVDAIQTQTVSDIIAGPLRDCSRRDATPGNRAPRRHRSVGRGLPKQYADYRSYPTRPGILKSGTIVEIVDEVTFVQHHETKAGEEVLADRRRLANRLSCPPEKKR